MRARRALLVALLGMAGCAGPAPEREAPEGPPQVDVDVQCTGNESFPQFRLLREVEDLLIDFGKDPSRESAILDAAQDLVDWYVTQGFPEARVGYELQREPKLRVLFGIQEGPRVTVSELTIRGNADLGREELLELWSRTQSGLLGLGDPYFVESDLRAFGLAMGDRYRGRGYLDVEVDGPQIERAPGGKAAKVGFEIREGPRYKLRAVAVADALRDAVATTVDVARYAGRPYDALDMRTLRLEIRRALEDAGYPDPEISLEEEVDAAGHGVVVKIAGTPGERRKIGRIEIAGNERTARFLIARELQVREGEWFHGGKIEASIRDLYATGLFRRVELERKTAGDGTLELVIRLEEIEARDVSLMVGWGSYELARTALYFGDRNLFGLGQRLRVGGKLSVKSLGTDATWTEPDLFGSKVGLSVTGFWKEREEPSFTDVSSGVSTALSRRLMARTQLRVGYGLESRDGRDIDDPDAPTDFRVGQVFAELSHDNRNSPLYPTRGRRELLRFEHASSALGGEIEFDRLTAGASWHLPLSGDEWTLSLAAQTGLLWPREGGSLPIQERFFAGGDSTVRSFKESELGPTLSSGKPAGGQDRNVLNAEVRFPIFRAIKGAVFADAGNVGRDVGDWGLSGMRYGLGGGLRLALPIGPVRVDGGWNPDRDPGERAWVVHLSVGFPF